MDAVKFHSSRNLAQVFSTLIAISNQAIITLKTELKNWIK